MWYYSCSSASCPIAATAHSTVKAYVPVDVDVQAADHDYESLSKVIPSVSLIMNIGEEPGDSLLSGGVDGNGKLYVSLHDSTFHKSTNFHHMSTSLDILRTRRIKKLVQDNKLPNSDSNIKYKDLSEYSRKIVDEHMPCS